MIETESHLARTERMRRRSRRNFLVVSGFFGTLLLAAAIILGLTYGPSLWSIWSYEPREGDIVFQSLPRSPLVNAIEGSTNSPWSHCAIVVRDDGRWYVYEALNGVERTPLRSFLLRSRDQQWAVFRLRHADDETCSQMAAAARSLLGRPYDSRFRWDDEAIYCSELIAKSHEKATGRSIGRKVPLGSLNWGPFERTIRALEGAAPPLERLMLTPRDLAASPELSRVTGTR